MGATISMFDYVWVRVGDIAERDFTTDRLHGPQYWGGLRSIC